MSPVLLRVALASLWNRRLATTLTVLSIGLSVALLLTIEAVRTSARQSFTGTVSRTDLIVGARGGSLQLLLYSVFRIGSATNNIRAESWKHFASHPAVAWTIPYSLGDSHRGFRVVATNGEFYERYRYRGDQRIVFSAGRAPEGPLEVALGAEVARALSYGIGQRITLSHGVSATSLMHHDESPFQVVGILERTGTPVDRSVYIPLSGMQAIHAGWDDGAPPALGEVPPPPDLTASEPKFITAFLLGAKSRIAVLRLQREINEYEEEPLLAIIPGVALAELWNTLGYAEQALLAVTACVLVAGLLSMVVALYTSLNERRREMAVLRSLGLGRGGILFLLVSEAVVCTVAGAVAGFALSWAAVTVGQPLAESQLGIALTFSHPSPLAWKWLSALLFSGVVAGFLPAWKAYRNSLSDGLTIRL